MLICVIIVIGVNILGKFLCPRDRWWRDAVLSCMSLCNSFQNSVWNLSLAYNFSTMKAKALIFHISIPCVKAFLCEPTFYTSWSWPFHFTYFLKTLTLLITFKPWVLEHWYFTWVILVTRLFSGYKHFYSLSSTLEFDLLENFHLAYNFLTVSARVS